MTLSVVIAGGGTGGHVFPGLALAEAIRQMVPAARITFVGTDRGIETRAVPAAGFPLETVDVLPWARTLGAKRFLAPASALRAAAQARAIMRRSEANVVAAMGGYASLPAALGARLCGVPVVVHEQNAIPGRANRISARFARRVAATFEESASQFPDPSRVSVIGNPIRSGIARMDRDSLRGEAVRSLSLDPARRTLLVTGGSQGAKRLNEAAIGLAQRWAARDDLQILLIAGPTTPIAERLPVLRTVSFLERMELAYAAADIALARAGAGLGELACAALPAILVPYPYARDDHQMANARAAARAGAAIVLPNAECTPDAAGAAVEAILDDAQRTASMQAAARAFARPDAARDLAEIVIQAVRAK